MAIPKEVTAKVPPACRPKLIHLSVGGKGGFKILMNHGRVVAMEEWE
jgi:hypothetical protein